MKSLRLIFRIVSLSLKLVFRTPVALFFTMALPILLFLLYTAVFGRGQPLGVAFVFGPLVTMLTISNGLMGVGGQVVALREAGTLRHYRLAPVGAAPWIVARIVSNFLLLVPIVALQLAAACLWFEMPLRSGLWELGLVLAAGALAISGLGMMVASVVNSMQEAQLCNQVLFIVLSFLSGATVPLAMLPSSVKRLAVFLPSSHMVSALQGLMLRGDAIQVHWPALLTLLSAGLTAIAFASITFRWTKEERAPARRRLAALLVLVPYLVLGVWLNISKADSDKSLESNRSTQPR